MEARMFRGMRLDTKEWVFGSLIVRKKKIARTRGDNTPEETVLVPYIDCDYTEHEVRPDTVGQCSGLKDKNGKLIFEGDIVKGNGEPHVGQSEVFFDAGRYQPFSYLGTYCGGEFEVVGTAFDDSLASTAG